MYTVARFPVTHYSYGCGYGCTVLLHVHCVLPVGYLTTHCGSARAVRTRTCGSPFRTVTVPYRITYACHLPGSTACNHTAHLHTLVTTVAVTYHHHTAWLDYLGCRSAGYPTRSGSFTLAYRSLRCHFTILLPAYNTFAGYTVCICAVAVTRTAFTFTLPHAVLTYVRVGLRTLPWLPVRLFSPLPLHTQHGSDTFSPRTLRCFVPRHTGSLVLTLHLRSHSTVTHYHKFYILVAVLLPAYRFGYRLPLRFLWFNLRLTPAVTRTPHLAAAILPGFIYLPHLLVLHYLTGLFRSARFCWFGSPFARTPGLRYVLRFAFYPHRGCLVTPYAYRLPAFGFFALVLLPFFSSFALYTVLLLRFCHTVLPHRTHGYKVTGLVTRATPAAYTAHTHTAACRTASTALFYAGLRLPRHAHIPVPVLVLDSATADAHRSRFLRFVHCGFACSTRTHAHRCTL